MPNSGLRRARGVSSERSFASPTPRGEFAVRKQIVSLIVVSLIPGSLLAVLLQSSEKKQTRAVSDKAFMEALLRDNLFDPKDCRRVSVEVVVRFVWGES